jgi:hypothetical protein
MALHSLTFANAVTQGVATTRISDSVQGSYRRCMTATFGWFSTPVPNTCFHYAYGSGIVGIYVGPTASYDFRNVLHNQQFRLGDLEAVEYRITASSDAVVPFSE